MRFSPRSAVVDILADHDEEVDGARRRQQDPHPVHDSVKRSNEQYFREPNEVADRVHVGSTHPVPRFDFSKHRSNVLAVRHSGVEIIVAFRVSGYEFQSLSHGVLVDDHVADVHRVCVDDPELTFE